MDIAEWLYKIGLSHLRENFEQEGIEADVLFDLTNDDLKELGVARLGERKRLLKAIKALQSETHSTTTQQPLTDNGPLAPPASTVLHEAQRRQLTVMFCDLVGSTNLSTLMDPEDLRDLIRSYQSVCRKEILAHEGFISRYMGDGILVYFGYPRANEHSAESAVRASLNIIDSMGALNREVARFQVDLSVRIGIATGPVVVGDLIGDGASEEAAVVGETPNLAARLQGLAEPNDVVISNATKRLTGASFDYRDLGYQELKGITSGVQAWQVLRESTENWRYSAKLTGDGTPLVDRREELSALMQCWNRSVAGAGQAVIVAAEAGMGKSRLAYAVEEQLIDVSHHLVRMQGVSFRRDTTLFPVLESIRSAANLTPEDTPQQQYQKLKAHTRGQMVGEVETFQLLAPLFSLDTSEEFEPLDIGPNQLKQLTLQALWKRIEKLAEEKPTYVFVEDYHWIDPTTREWLDLAITDIARSRAMLVISQRLEGKADEDWSRHPQATVVALGKLAAEDVQQLVSNTAAASVLSNELQREIYRKTDGNPLFVEELTQMLLEQQRSDGSNTAQGTHNLDTGIPTTLQDLLLARLDQLGSARSLAQHAACYGRTFSKRGLEIISSLQTEQLAEQLQQLLTSGLIHTMPDSDDLYEFKHALVQDAAYESQLKSTRVRIHQKIADHFEPELCDKEPEVLAYHFGRAGNRVQERVYWHKAARRAMGSGAFVEAINYFQQALRALAKDDHQSREAKVPDTTDPEFTKKTELELELLVECAVPSTLTKGWASPEVGQAYERAHQLSQQQGSSPLLFAALSGIFRYYLVTGNYQLAEQVALIDLERAEQSGDEGVIMEFVIHPGVVCYYTGQPTRALPYLSRCAALYDSEKHKHHVSIYGQCTGTVALSHLGKALAILGRTQEGYASCREGSERAEQSGHAFSIAWGLSNHAANHILLENAPACYEMATKIIEIGTKADFANWLAQGLVWQGWALAHGGDAATNASNTETNDPIANGLEKIHQGMAIWKMTGASLMQPFYYILLAQCHLLGRQLPEAESALASGLELMDNTGELWPKPLWQLTAEKVAVANGTRTPKQARDTCLNIIRKHAGKNEWLWAAKAYQYINVLDGNTDESLLQQPLHNIAEQYGELSTYSPLAEIALSLKD